MGLWLSIRQKVNILTEIKRIFHTDKMKPKMYISQYEEIKMPTYFAPNPEDNVRNVKELRYKDGDVLICAYPKSGSHWTETLIRGLLRKDQDENILSKPSIIDFRKPEFFESMSSPRVLFTHLWPKRMPKEHMEKRGKMVLMLRNPKDVVVAAYYHFTQDPKLDYTNNWDEHFEDFINGDTFFGDMFEYLKNWQDAIKAEIFDIKHFYYEDLKLDPVETLKGIAEHIGVIKTNEELHAILEECSIANMKKMVEHSDLPFPSEDKSAGYYIYRKGEIGDWKNHFTVAQAERFDVILEQKLKDSTFGFKYE